MAPRLEPVTEAVWLGEGPHWDHLEQALYFVSIFDHTIHKYVPSTGHYAKAKLGEYQRSSNMFTCICNII
jgi:sugar lactone lactonase YvrE